MMTDTRRAVWDWRTGEKRCRWGQQSNVSLGVAIVNDDQVVAATVDAVIRVSQNLLAAATLLMDVAAQTFSIRRKEMIGEYHISKLAGGAKARELAGLGGDANMMLWVCASHGTARAELTKDLALQLVCGAKAHADRGEQGRHHPPRVARACRAHRGRAFSDRITRGHAHARRARRICTALAQGRRRVDSALAARVFTGQYERRCQLAKLGWTCSTGFDREQRVCCQQRDRDDERHFKAFARRRTNVCSFAAIRKSQRRSDACAHAFDISRHAIQAAAGSRRGPKARR
jgi:hypothetical protein